MSGFTFNNIINIPPVGTIVQYCGNDTLDPDGWVICNGQSRTTSDNRYVNLAPLLNNMQAGSFTGSITDTILTVTSVASGIICIGQTISGTNIQVDTKITEYGTGTGDTGTYTVSISKTVSSTTISAITSHNSNNIVPPDLRSRFLFGSGSTNSNIGTIGGSSSQTLTTNHLPSHSHAGGSTGNQSNNHTHEYYAPGTSVNTEDQANWEATYNLGNTKTSDNSVGHTHDYTLDAIPDSGNSINILPSYFKINYIMKY